MSFPAPGYGKREPCSPKGVKVAQDCPLNANLSSRLYGPSVDHGNPLLPLNLPVPIPALFPAQPHMLLSIPVPIPLLVIAPVLVLVCAAATLPVPDSIHTFAFTIFVYPWSYPAPPRPSIHAPDLIAATVLALFPGLACMYTPDYSSTPSYDSAFHPGPDAELGYCPNVYCHSVPFPNPPI